MSKKLGKIHAMLIDGKTRDKTLCGLNRSSLMFSCTHITGLVECKNCIRSMIKRYPEWCKAVGIIPKETNDERA